ncbi:hypothetical protein SASPL_138452 [Salvia splendens]|uniref:DUF7804 domain-containing protein n=1 Tax=Salvia splendens TaxID=180675 RepID=A0A8X8WV71_SALSN|nr:hypothetical protein SASPL_138452 [Salvia splendens]
MDATREELPDTMAIVRLSGMEISDLTMELNDNGSDSELFCFRSRELVEVTKSSKDLRHSVPAVLEDLVPDIVRNLKQAPLLVQIYSRLDGRVRIETEKAVPEEWPAAREGWRSGESKSLCLD